MMWWLFCNSLIHLWCTDDDDDDVDDSKYSLYIYLDIVNVVSSRHSLDSDNITSYILSRSTRSPTRRCIWQWDKSQHHHHPLLGRRTTTISLFPPSPYILLHPLSISLSLSTGRTVCAWFDFHVYQIYTSLAEATSQSVVSVGVRTDLNRLEV